jgi:hypothetical protein
MFSKHVLKNISAYCHGELSVDESREFSEHILACVRCRSAYEEIKLGIKFAEQLPQLSPSANLWQRIEANIETIPNSSQGSRRFSLNSWQTQMAVAAAVLLVVALLGIWWMRRAPLPPPVNTVAFWEVERVNGTVRVGSCDVEKKGQLPVGEWLETDGDSIAQIAVSSIGHVEVEANTRIRLVETRPDEHRLELARGKLSARIWAPPRLFFVDTPSAVAADLGCAYTLEVDDAGASLLRVTSGWVALELKDRESMVPAGAACETQPGVGPGTPYFEDANQEFRQSLRKVDFDSSEVTKKVALGKMLNNSRSRDTLTLWHLLPRVAAEERGKIYDKIASFAPPPKGVTREGVLQLNGEMLESWRVQLEDTWALSTPITKEVAEAYWRVKNGIERPVNKTK